MALAGLISAIKSSSNRMLFADLAKNIYPSFSIHLKMMLD